VPGVGLARERANDLAHPLRADKRGEALVCIAGVVVDDGELARTLRDERIDELGRHACIAEAVDHDRRAVGNIGERGFQARHEFIDHR
jgi:hypothetical protein